jgi:uncharacterized RDD family membrane protein YckC
VSDTPGPPPAAPPPPAGSGAATGTAGLGARFGARVLDALIVFIPASILLGLVGVGVGGGMGGFGLDGWLFNAITSLLWFGYYVYFESTSGATLGKKLLNLRVVSADGSPPSTEAAAKRNIWMLFGIVPFIGGLAQFIAVIVIAVTISSGEANRGKHDEFAGTGVLR